MGLYQPSSVGLSLFCRHFRLPAWSKEGGGGVPNEGFPHGIKKVMADFSTILSLFHRISAKWGCGLSLFWIESRPFRLVLCGLSFLQAFYLPFPSLLRVDLVFFVGFQANGVVDLDFFYRVLLRGRSIWDCISQVQLDLDFFVDLCNLGTRAPFLLDRTSSVGLRLLCGLVQSGYGSTFFIRSDKFSWT